MLIPYVRVDALKAMLRIGLLSTLIILCQWVFSPLATASSGAPDERNNYFRVAYVDMDKAAEIKKQVEAFEDDESKSVQMQIKVLEGVKKIEDSDWRSFAALESAYQWFLRHYITGSLGSFDFEQARPQEIQTHFNRVLYYFNLYPVKSSDKIAGHLEQILLKLALKDKICQPKELELRMRNSPTQVGYGPREIMKLEVMERIYDSVAEVFDQAKKNSLNAFPKIVQMFYMQRAQLYAHLAACYEDGDPKLKVYHNKSDAMLAKAKEFAE